MSVEREIFETEIGFEFFILLEEVGEGILALAIREIVETVLEVLVISCPTVDHCIEAQVVHDSLTAEHSPDQFHLRWQKPLLISIGFVDLLIYLIITKASLPGHICVGTLKHKLVHVETILMVALESRNLPGEDVPHIKYLLKVGILLTVKVCVGALI